jgi:hypothetical protein
MLEDQQYTKLEKVHFHTQAKTIKYLFSINLIVIFQISKTII